MVQTNRIVIRKPLIVIAGPTAVGKSALGIAVAKRLNGEIISVDSMQIYREMTIGTAKPAVSERGGVRHRMVDVASCLKPFAAGDYVELAKSEIGDVFSSGKTPILVGGTGMYLKALLYGYRLGGHAVVPEIRAKYSELATKSGGEVLYGMLSERAPERAKKIHPNDTVRIVRALELLDTVGQITADDPHSIIPHTLYVLTLDRARLYERINGRVDLMLERGLVKEVKCLLKAGASPELSSMQAIGYKEIAEYLLGKTDFDTAVARIKQNTRRYAKRQLTFFRHMDNVKWINCDTDLSIICDTIEEDHQKSSTEEVYEWTSQV